MLPAPPWMTRVGFGILMDVDIEIDGWSREDDSGLDFVQNWDRRHRSRVFDLDTSETNFTFLKVGCSQVSKT